MSWRRDPPTYSISSFFEYNESCKKLKAIIQNMFSFLFFIKRRTLCQLWPSGLAVGVVGLPSIGPSMLVYGVVDLLFGVEG